MRDGAAFVCAGPGRQPLILLERAVGKIILLVAVAVATAVIAVNVVPH